MLCSVRASGKMTHSHLLTWLVCGLGACFLGGCHGWSTSPEERKPEGPPPPPISLLVVDNPALAVHVARLEDEWRGQAGFGFTVEAIDATELKKRAETGSLQADAVVLPYLHFPLLAEYAGLEPIPRSILEDPRGQWTGIFGTLRVRQLRWAEKPVAVPLGLAVFVLYIRSDLLDRLEAKPPTTWQEYYRLAEKLARIDTATVAPPPLRGNAVSQPAGQHESAVLVNESAGGKVADAGEATSGQVADPQESAGAAQWFGTLEPLGPGWGGQMLLARAAAYIAHRDQLSTFFSIEDMSPLIDREPFVRALEELRAAAQLGPAPIALYSAAEVRQAFWQGKCGMAITCPTSAQELKSLEEPPPVAFAELPGSADVYDIRRAQWEKRRREESVQIPLLGIGGWVGAVPQSGSRKQEAFQLLFWLSREQSQEIAARLPDCTLYRSEHMTQAKRWVDPPATDAAAIELALVVRQMLEKPVAVLTLGVPGTEEYLQALDEAVAAAVRSELSPRDALSRARDKWEAITRKWGPERQLRAYKHSINLP